MPTGTLTTTEQSVVGDLAEFEYFADDVIDVSSGGWGHTITRDIASRGNASNAHAAAGVLSSLLQKGILVERPEFAGNGDRWFELTAEGYEAWLLTQIKPDTDTHDARCEGGIYCRCTARAATDASVDANATEHAERTRALLDGSENR